MDDSQPPLQTPVFLRERLRLFPDRAIVSSVAAGIAGDEGKKEAPMTAGTILLFLALICFVLATFGFVIARINLTAAGLACAVAAVLVGSYVVG